MTRRLFAACTIAALLVLPLTLSPAATAAATSGPSTTGPVHDAEAVGHANKSAVSQRGGNRRHSGRQVASSKGRAILTSAESDASYWLAASDGGIFSFGGLPFYGSMGGQHLNEPIVGMAPSGDGTGYWEVAADGGIFAFHAPFYGSMGGTPLDDPVVAMAVDPATGGYWEVASDGGIFAFHAPFFGSMGGKRLNDPIVGMAPTPSGQGYWLVASDGGIFSFGDATFLGSTGSTPLDSPVVGMAAVPTGQGYWLVASDGGVFAYGDAPFEGSLGSDPLTYPVAAMASTGVASTGYWIVNSNGAVSSFGTAGNFGSAPQHLNAPIVAIVDGPGNGTVTDTAAPSGSFGYDVSNYQCSDTLPSGHTIGIVEATGWGGSAGNPCLSQEATWAGGGLQLYIFLIDGTSSTNEPGCDGDTSCNFGFQSAQTAYDYVQSQGVTPDVPWWLDVEAANWSSNTAENAQVVNGALIELRGLGVNTVGVYTSPLTWSSLVGTYQPPVPIWLAWYTGSPQQNCSTGVSYAASNGDELPTGGILMTQYTDDASGTGMDGDYAC